MTDRSHTPLEIWAGPECTLNRVADRYFDQLAMSGHDRRLDDLDRIAGLGVSTVRYPVLWERTDASGWAFSDERLPRLRELGLRPIAGLLHHGSGPPHTSLLDDDFPDKLAAYAGAVAARYPWIDAYTPVNEPLTTARFSALYGHWYPHAVDDQSFVRALLQQCRGTVLAMRAIRAIHPGAALIQTDDLGRTHATSRLRYQAEFENERRWLTFDLLCGRVDHDHPLRAWLRWVGAPDADVDWFLDAGCPPDVIGGNYYVTSERFLDEEFEAWPASTHGGNDRHRYADVEAVRAGVALDLPALLRQAWARFRRPLALTEVHLGCTREEQLRWLHDVWLAIQGARGDGVDIRALTVWSVFGAHDWDSLVTRAGGRYEPGVFDVRGAVPRETALAALVRTLARGEVPAHPVLADPGWWHRVVAEAQAAA